MKGKKVLKASTVHIIDIQEWLRFAGCRYTRSLHLTHNLRSDSFHDSKAVSYSYSPISIYVIIYYFRYVTVIPVQNKFPMLKSTVKCL